MSEVANRLPMAMRTTFQDLILFTFRVDPDELGRLLPPLIHPIVVGGGSFVSIVIANMRGMRVSGVPEFLGANAYQIVYRSVVEIRRRDGSVVPGVFFLRSDCNDPVLTLFGNQLTEFRFHHFRTSSIGLFQRNDQLLTSVRTRERAGDLVAVFRDRGSSSQLPAARPFFSVDQEHRVLVELFHAFAYDASRQVVYDMEIERGKWQTNRLDVIDHFSAFFCENHSETLSGEPISSLAIQECAYLWKPMVSIDANELVVR